MSSMRRESSNPCFLPLRKNRSEDRLLPEDRSPQRITLTRSADPPVRCYSNELYQSLVEGIHPDQQFISSSNLLEVSSSAKHKKENPILQKLKKPVNSVFIPSLPTDFYVHPIDWSKADIIAVGRKASVTLFCHQPSLGTLVFNQFSKPYSLQFSPDGMQISIGSSKGSVSIVDIMSSQVLKEYRPRTSGMVSVLRNMEGTIISGDHSGAVTVYDPSCDEPAFRISKAHLEGICNIAVSPFGNVFASGGDDSAVKIWDIRSLSKPAMQYSGHTAAVRGIAFSPEQREVICTGGGSNDTTIQTWNIDTGETICKVLSESQVCNLIWSKNKNIIMSSHGFSSNSVALWKPSNLKKLGCSNAHINRVLYAAAAPDESLVLTAAPNDWMHYWNFFAKESKASDRAFFSLR